MPGAASGSARARRVLLLATLAILVYPTAPAGAVECRGGGSGSAAVDQYCDPFGDVAAAGRRAREVPPAAARRARRLGRDGADVLALAAAAGRADPASSASTPGPRGGPPAGRSARSPAPAGALRPAARRLPPAAARTGPAGPTASVGLLAILGALGVIVLALARVDARRR